MSNHNNMLYSIVSIIGSRMSSVGDGVLAAVFSLFGCEEGEKDYENTFDRDKRC